MKNGLDSLEVFKEELKSVLLGLIQGQNVLRQELFLIRNNQVLSSAPQAVLPRSETGGSLSTSTTSIPPTEKSTSPPSTKGSARPAPPPSISTPSSASPRVKMPFSKQEAVKPILFIGDSISANIDIAALESATQRKIVTAKAYSAVHDEVSMLRKMPRNSPPQISPNLKNIQFHSLVIQSGSVDITNMQTKHNASEYLEYFKQEAMVSEKTIFTVGVNALTNQPSLEKIVIMKLILFYSNLSCLNFSTLHSLSFG